MHSEKRTHNERPRPRTYGKRTHSGKRVHSERSVHSEKRTHSERRRLRTNSGKRTHSGEHMHSKRCMSIGKPQQRLKPEKTRKAALLGSLDVWQDHCPLFRDQSV